MGGTPDWLKGKTVEQQREYFDHAYRFFEDSFGKENIISSVVHLDEATPHMHLCFVPITEKGRLSSKEIIGGPKGLVNWQDKFYAYMHEKYPDITRGTPARLTHRKHIPPFIALNDGIDTVNSHTTDYAALKNVINEFYSRDTSRKIKAAFRARAKDGKYHAKAAPFGYLKDPNDHNHLIPDPETAPIVAKIYDLVLKGWGNYRIRDYLRETKVPVPSWYQHIRGVEDKSHMFPNEDSKYIWRPDTLRLLIRNRVYCGDCVLCKSDTIFKTKQHFKTDEKEWITVENTHEAIVSRETWERANELVAVKRREYRKTLSGNLNIFSGLLKCADCGKALSRRKYGSNSGHMIYVCGTYATYGSHKCT